jgi:hypothetical protein
MCIFKNELLETLSILRGLKCWNVYSCGGGPTLQLSLGKAFEFQLTLEDKTIKRYDGQYDLFFLCSWRLDNKNDSPIISSSKCDYDEIKENTISLIGDFVESIEITSSVYDATIRFSSGKQLKIFCDQIIDGAFNWCFDNYTNVYYIGPGKKISKSTRLGLVSDILYEPDELDPAYVISDKNYQHSYLEDEFSAEIEK